MNQLHLRKAGWGLVVVVILVAGHGIVLYHVASRFTRSVFMGLIVLLVLKHLGLFSSIYAIFRRRSRGST